MRHDSMALRYSASKVCHPLPQGRFARGGLQLTSLHSNARIDEQVLNEPLHPVGPIHRISYELVSVRTELTLIALGEQLRIASHHPQRFLKVVRGKIGKLSKLLVRSVELSDGKQEDGLSLLPRRYVAQRHCYQHSIQALEW